MSLLVITSVILIPQDTYAASIIASPRTAHFGPNDSIKVDLSISGYVGGNVTWAAHRPDNSTISGSLVQLQGGKITHQIIRDAYDNYFGKWSIDYSYNGINQTASFVVDPIMLSVKPDKGLYYDGEKMKVNITTSYFIPTAHNAEYYHLNFYDKKGNPTRAIDRIDIRAYQPSTTYNFPIDSLVRNNPLGQYKIKVQYYNVITEIPFEVGDIEKRMTISVRTDKSIYQVHDSVDLKLIFSKVKKSEGVMKITNPSGNTTVTSFPVNSVVTKLHLEKAAVMPGKYALEVRYGGVTQDSSFIVENPVNVTKEAGTVLELALDKQKYRPGEIVSAKIHTTDLIADSLSFWFEDPLGTQGPRTSIPIISADATIPYKINKDDLQGIWKINVDYGGAKGFATFSVEGEPVDSTNVVTANIITPKLLTTLGLDTGIKFKNPRGIAVDSDDNVYVVDTGTSQIKKFDSSGNLLMLWGSYGTANGQFKNPSGLFIDKKYVYVADTANARIQKFDKNGNFVYSWGAFGEVPGMFHTPVALSADSEGNLYVSDSGLAKILVFDSNGQYKDEIRSLLAADAKFSSTNFITFDSKNNFYVAVSNDNRVLEYSSIGTFIKSFGTEGEQEGQFNKPSSIAIDSRGNLYVTDTNNHRIQKFDSQERFLISWGSLGTAPGQFKEPVGVAVDSKDSVYVVDRANNNVQKFAAYFSSGEIIIPEWIRNNAGWWADGAISDSDFAAGIQYMINQKIIKIPNRKSVGSSSGVTIPSWVKINAGWWSDKKISDKDFANSIQYLISIRMIKI